MIRGSADIGQIAAALVAAQGDFPTVNKTQTAKVGTYSYRYADLPAVVEASRPVLKAHGLAVLQFPSEIGLTTVIVHDSGEWIAEEMVLPVTQDTPQGQGSAITYARRYAYCGALGIIAEEDDDAQAAQADGSQARTTTRGPSDAQLRKLAVSLDEAGHRTRDEKHRFCSAAVGREIESAKELTSAEVSAIIRDLEG